MALSYLEVVFDLYQVLKERMVSYEKRATWAEERTRKAERKFSDLEIQNASLTCKMQVRVLGGSPQIFDISHFSHNIHLFVMESLAF